MAPTGLTVGEVDNLELGVSWWPPQGSDIVFVGLAGGGMKRQYFDLQGGFSFVAAMRARGHGCLLVDHPGVGDSDRPSDGYLLSPRLLAEAHHRALGALRGSLPELAAARTVGVGHSMGALISLIQQAGHGSHAALVLLGFGFDGLPQYLPPAARALLNDRAALEAVSVELARGLFREPYPIVSQGGNGGLYAGSNAEPGALEAIRNVSTHLLPLPAFMSMYPHHWDALAARVKVPVLIALGDKDLVKAPDNVDQLFSGSPGAEVLVLPETGHSQFVFASRAELFAKIDQWVEQI